MCVYIFLQSVCCLLCTHALPLLRYFLLEVNSKPCVSFTKRYIQTHTAYSSSNEQETHIHKRMHTHMNSMLNYWTPCRTTCMCVDHYNAYNTITIVTEITEAIPIYVYARLVFILCRQFLLFLFFSSSSFGLFVRLLLYINRIFSDVFVWVRVCMYMYVCLYVHAEPNFLCFVKHPKRNSVAFQLRQFYVNFWFSLFDNDFWICQYVI